MPIKTKVLWQQQIGLEGDPTANDMWKNTADLIVKNHHTILSAKPIFERIDDQKLSKIKEVMSIPFEIESLKD